MHTNLIHIFNFLLVFSQFSFQMTDDAKSYVKIVYKEKYFYFPIVKSTKPVEIKRLLIPYIKRKIRDMKLVIEEFDETVELKRRFENEQTVYLILRDPETQKFEKLKNVKPKK